MQDRVILLDWVHNRDGWEVLYIMKPRLQVVTEIWTLNEVARKTITIIAKLIKGYNLHCMQDRVILLNYLHRYDSWEAL